MTVAGLRVRFCRLNRCPCGVSGAHSSTLGISPGFGGHFACVCTCVQVFATPWTVARQAPLSMGFSRQEDWSGLPFPPPGGLPDPGIKPASPALGGRFFTVEPLGVSYLEAHPSSSCPQAGLDNLTTASGSGLGGVSRFQSPPSSHL